MTRSRLSGPLLAAVTLLISFMTWVGTPSPAAVAASGDIGYQGPAYNGSGGAPTADKPQSKLWFNDGHWWADMFDVVSKSFHIFRLDRPSQTWVNTGTQLDSRPSTRADVLWSGEKLYVASAVKASSSASNVSAKPARLFRYSYNQASRSYSLDAGFPVAINDVSSESLTLDRDSRGVLWATWTQNQQVYINSTSGSDTQWGTPSVLPVAGATGLDPDDISAVTAFGRTRVGVFWSNQSSSTFYFATHRDGDPRGTWTGQVAASGPRIADDHISVKQLEGDDLGHLYAAVKTSYGEAATDPPSSPSVELMALNPNSGKWDTYVYGTVADCHTRPMLMIDSANRQLHMFATAPTSGCAYSGAAGAIFHKSSPMSNIAFAPGRGTAVMQDGSSQGLNNVTGTKQNLNANTGLVLLASNDSTARYWHTDMPLGQLPPPPPAAPSAGFTVSATSGTAPVEVSFTDTSAGTPTSWQWDFGDGSTSVEANPSHTFTSAGTYTVSLKVTNSGGSDTASKTVTVDAPPPPTTVEYGSSSSTAQATATTSVTLTKPSGTTAGDFLVASFTTAAKPTIARAPAGWVPLLTKPLRPGNAASVFAYYHVVEAGDEAWNGWTWTLSAAQKWGGGISRYTGVDPTTPLAASVTSAVDHTYTATKITVPGVTTDTNGAMVIGGLGADGATPTVAPPTGYTEAWESTGGKVAEQAYSAQGTAGTTGPRTWTISEGRALGAWMTALRPATNQ
jgi:PKD repeat protein